MSMDVDHNVLISRLMTMARATSDDGLEALLDEAALAISALTLLAKEREELREALRRLGSNEAFTNAFMPQGQAADELDARIVFARSVNSKLKGE